MPAKIGIFANGRVLLWPQWIINLRKKPGMEHKKDQRVEVMDHLSLGEFVVRSSVSIVSLDPATQIPCNWGSGFMLRYQGRHFLVTVYHVIKVDLDHMYIEMGKDASGHGTLQPIGGFYTFGQIGQSDTENRRA